MVASLLHTPRLVVAGTHSGVGKTTVATGLMSALASKGCDVAPFKVGPDFIDPSYHALVAGRPGRNLDSFLAGEELVPRLFAHGAAGADVAVIEGVMGLFDGKGGGGDTASTAQVAKLLNASVVLVVDAGAMARSAAAMVHGYRSFDPEVDVAGVVLNRVGSDKHEQMLREAIEPLGVPVLGAMRRGGDLSTPDRHLGLVPAAERSDEARRSVERMGEAVSRHCDLEAVMRLARSAGPLRAEPWSPESGESAPARVAVAAGRAFSFAYRENLELLEGAGAEVVHFDPLRDETLPEGAGALYLGGGFPEAYTAELSENEPLRREVAAFARGGAPVIAECGGMMYLSRGLDGKPMCGVLGAESEMGGRLTLGYREAVAASESPLCGRGAELRGHEFHYSSTRPPAGGIEGEAAPAWTFDDRRSEGFVAGGVHASYLHTHWAAYPGVARRLVSSAARANVSGARS
ncbi:cobyrinate a,c-diamide synthase [Rubrobacter aplysinae]|uniref:cobyrinate a,c-diamide synthase n=1 Tax=Rubrobacter aplysinae TaxID=909625 RepID=UPI00064BB7AD|nr:cobyrinate a,c-diamide synthase [Rubrobacter aplysinae]